MGRVDALAEIAVEVAESPPFPHYLQYSIFVELSHVSVETKVPRKLVPKSVCSD